MDRALTILVVDDRAINREFLISLFGFAGYGVQSAADGTEALALVATTRPDLIITDLLMPIMDGMELARRLRADPSTTGIPIVFYTATYRLDEAQGLARDCGVQLVIPKPSSPRAILEGVASLLGRPLQTFPSEDMRAPPGLLGGTTTDLTGLGKLQQHLQRMLQQGEDLLSEGGRVQQLAAHLEQSLAAAQALGLRLTTLVELGLDLAAEREPGRLLGLFVRAAQAMMSARYAAAALADRDGQIVHLATRGLPDAVRNALGTQPPAGLLAQALRSGTPQRLKDWSEPTPPPGLPEGHPALQSLLVLPIRTQLRSYGWLYLADKLGAAAFAAEDEQIAATFAAQLALTCENLALFEDTQSYARELEQEMAVRRESESRFRQLAENIREVFWLVNPTVTEFFYVSPAYEEVWGKSCASLYSNPMSWQEHVHPDDREGVMAAMGQMRETGQLDVLFRLVRPDVGLRWINARGFPIGDDRGVLIRIAGIAEDVTKSKRAEDRIARLNRVKAVLSGINAAIVRIRERQALFAEACRLAVEEGRFELAWIGLVDSDELRLLAWQASHPAWRSQGIAADEREVATAVLRSDRAAVCNELPHTNCPTATGASGEPQDQGFCSRAVLPLSQNGTPVGVMLLYAPEAGFFDDEELLLLDELSGDISFALQYMDKEDRINYLAYYDVLTGLPNRSLFMDRLGQFLQGAKHGDHRVTLILVDLDHFKRINDNFGRHVGDAVLESVAARFTAALIEPYSLARVGADSFAIAVASLTPQSETEAVLKTGIFQPLEKPVVIGENSLRVSVRVGVAVYPGDGGDADTLFDHAEAALRRAQVSGERVLYFDPDVNAQIAETAALEEDLRQALDRRQLELHYQPKVSLHDGRISGAEALLRWRHPLRGLVSPMRFIPLAEETGLIIPIGAWVLHAACAQQADWLASGLPVVPVGVNLSAVQFRSSQVLDLVTDALAQNNLAPGHLDLELTESLVMQDPEGVARVLGALRARGVTLSLDDFGTGYSSLARLKHFPFNTLKIDRAFVTEIIDNPEDAAIATAIVTLARRLGLKVVAEGVETVEQLAYLRELGCDEMQGYLFSKPLPPAEFADLLKAGTRLALNPPAVHA